MSGAASQRLPDGRLHLQHGPIDCLVEAWGAPAEVEAAYAQASAAFANILPSLVAELPQLRRPAGAAVPLLRGPVARRMTAAVWPHRPVFVTPMAAVAGAVADELLEAMLRGRALSRACVNDGGDIAMYLSPGTQFTIGIATDPARAALAGEARIRAADPSRGIATSGWRGRSQSLGIADAVTVLAASAAAADAAATLIANAVNVDHPAVRRLPARTVKEDSDLGDLLVTVKVGELPSEAVAAALDAGCAAAEAMLARGLIHAAWLGLGGRCRALPDPARNLLAARAC